MAVLAMLGAACAGAPPAAALESLAPPACGAADRPTPALDGQIPLTERDGAWERAYTCNLELAGQDVDEGASWQAASHDHCAYYGTADGWNQVQPGTRVVDASDPRTPRTVDYLAVGAMRDPWESLEVNHRRGLLAAVRNGGPGFTVYDINGDCAHPRLLADMKATADVAGHAGTFAPDGMTYYGATAWGAFYAFDLADPARPTELGSWQPPVAQHDVSVNEDGTRMYVAGIGGTTISTDGVQSDNGLAILDIGDIQNRRAEAEPRVVSTLFWADGSGAQEVFKVKIGGRPYLIQTDELGSDLAPQAACLQHLPPYGFARLIDIADETAPKVVSKLILEANDPVNCALTSSDNTAEMSFGYDAHYCNVDSREDAHYLACSQFQSGLRIYDISDPLHPRNVAYYVPPAREAPAGSSFYTESPDGKGDWVSAKPQFHHGDQIWFTSMNNGFQVVRLTNGARFAQPSSDEELPPPPPAAPPPPAERAAPPTPPCRPTLRLSLRWLLRGRRAWPPRSLTIFLDGRRVKRLRGRAVRGTITLRPRRPHSATVRVVAVGRKGRRIVRVRTYRFCD